jgi:hypothetical protein
VEGTDPQQGEYTSTSGNRLDFMKELRSESGGDLGRGVADNGHEFDTTKNSIVWHPPFEARNPSGPYGNIRVTGCIASFYDSPQYPPMSYPSVATKVANGSALIGMCAPTTPEVGIAAFLGELREGLPKVIGLEFLLGPNARKLGSEHLNLQFGVKPLISDLKKTARGIIDFQKRISQVKRDSGRYVRRRAQLQGSSTSIDRGFASGSGVRFPSFYSIDGADQFYSYRVPETRVVDNYQSEVWFSGAFTYHLAQAHSFLGKMERYEQLAQASLGTRFDESTAWQLTPWSWMVDWFADVGGFVHNVDMFSSDNLVMRYGYVMHRTTCTRVYSTSGLILRPGATAPTGFSDFLTSTRKERMRASPYGFGVDLSGLSPRRLAIIGALGLTKAPGKMKWLG